jgi:RNA polymerase sigma-70 factor, ECF subfamily
MRFSAGKIATSTAPRPSGRFSGNFGDFPAYSGKTLDRPRTAGTQLSLPYPTDQQYRIIGSSEVIMRHAQAPQIAPAGTADAELVKLARGRDEAAIRSIMQSNNRRLYRIARGILRNDSEAEDVVQETYVRAFTHLQSFRGDSSLATWLARIAMNEALGRLRRQRPGVEWTSLPPGVLEAQIIHFPLSASSADPEKSMAQREIQLVVEHAIDDLPDAFRIVFITRVIEGMNVEETAEILGLKPETVKTRLHRARAMLRENIEKKIGPVVMEAFPFAGKRCERLTDAVLKRLGLT